MLQTEFEFTLPYGFIDDEGTLHRDGVMRLSTALDELDAMRDPRVRANEAYLTVILLSRVVTRLGTIEPITPSHVERLFSADFVYLQDLFVHANEVEHSAAETQCPTCGTRFRIDLAGARSA